MIYGAPNRLPKGDDLLKLPEQNPRSNPKDLLTFHVLDLLDVVGEAAARHDEEELDERDDQGEEGAGQQQPDDVLYQGRLDHRHAAGDVDGLLDRRDRWAGHKRGLKMN